jgi:hypothetical protein
LLVLVLVRRSGVDAELLLQEALGKQHSPKRNGTGGKRQSFREEAPNQLGPFSLSLSFNVLPLLFWFCFFLFDEQLPIWAKF